MNSSISPKSFKKKNLNKKASQRVWSSQSKQNSLITLKQNKGKYRDKYSIQKKQFQHKKWVVYKHYLKKKLLQICKSDCFRERKHIVKYKRIKKQIRVSRPMKKPKKTQFFKKSKSIII